MSSSSSLYLFYFLSINQLVVPNLCYTRSPREMFGGEAGKRRGSGVRPPPPFHHLCFLPPGRCCIERSATANPARMSKTDKAKKHKSSLDLQNIISSHSLPTTLPIGSLPCQHTALTCTRVSVIGVVRFCWKLYGNGWCSPENLADKCQRARCHHR